MPKAVPVEVTPADLTARLKDLARRCNAREPGALVELRAFLDEHPEVTDTIGNLGRLAELAYVGLLAGDDALSREAITRRLAQLKRDLAGEHATPMEALLVESVGLSYLSLHQATLAGTAPGASPAVLQLHAKRAETEQRRLIQAIRTLATLRTLLPKGLAPVGSVKLFAPAKVKKQA